MRRLRSRGAPRSLIIALLLLGGSACALAQQAAPQPATQGAAGGGAARGPGRPTTPVLGDGPWTLATEAARIEVSVVTKGLDHPWGMVFLPDGDMLVTERPGRLRVVRDGTLDPTPISGLPAIEPGLIGGLLDIALHPDFATNRLLYFSYSKPDAADSSLQTTAVARARWDGGTQLTNVEDVFVADAWHSAAIASAANRCCGQGPAGGSYGSRIVFDAAGLLYVTVGDRNYGERAQDPASDLGKIVRLHDDGSIPDDNPFVGREGYNPEIYTLGHRNPLGLTIHPDTGELWSTEFGPRGGDELNRIVAGKNYGWMLVTEGAHYNDEPVALGSHSVPGMEDPVLFWVPSINPGNIVFYTGAEIAPWRGDLLMATMTRSLLRARFDDAGHAVGQERMLTELGQRLRDVRQGPDGLVYVLTDETDGALLRIAPAH
jgi:glucose/arabinose dehydrogenase